MEYAAGGRRKIIKGCLSRWKAAIICLLETKMEVIDDRFIKSIWGIKDFGWLHRPALGLARGILLLWNKDLVVCKNSFIGNITVLALFASGHLGTEWYFTGVYCRGQQRRKEFTLERTI